MENGSSIIDGTTRANAIHLSGGNNTLTLQSGYSFTGNVVSTSGAANGGDTLVLGGSTNPSAAFKVSNIVASLPGSSTETQYVGFANFAKTGTSTWQLTGTGSAGQNWSVADGILRGDANTFAGNIRFAPASPASTPGVVFDQGSGNTNSAASAVYAGTIGGAGSFTKTGDGTLTLSGANSYTGTTMVDAGVLRAGIANSAFGIRSAVTVNGGATLDLDSFNQAIGSLAGAGNVTLGSGTLTSGGDNTSTTFSGAISGTGGLTKSGAGTLTLAGANTYGGATTVGAGTLRAGTVNSFSAASAVTLAGASVLDLNDNSQTIGSLAGAGAVTLGSGTLTTGSDNTSTTYSGVISGSGGLIKTGTGTFTLDQDNTYTGGTIINAGTLSGSAASFGSGLITNNATLQVDWPADASFAGTITGSGAFVKTGAGMLTLTGVNTYTGGTTISTGILTGSATSFGSGPIANNAALRIEQPVDAPLANTITGSGAVTKTGAGTLTLEGENSYSGGTDLKQGGLAVRNNSALGTGALAMHGGTTLRFAADGLTLANPVVFTDAVDPIIDTGAFTSTLAGAITGPGDLSKIGSGTLVLSGANSYTGATAVNEGTLRAGAADTFSPASAHSVAAGATLDLAGFDQSIASLGNAGTVSLIGAAPGTTLTVTGPYVGNNGLLRLGTSLGDSASVSDRLVLNGPTAAASGRTTVQVANLGGLGALTTGNGIELIGALNGATTTAQSTKDAFALQGGHVDAGAYEYRLQPGDANGAGESWYLRSTSTVVVPQPPAPPPPAPPAPSPAPDAPAPAPPPASAPSTATIQVPTYRAEVPLFAALPEQLRQGNLAMLANLHQRMGDDDVKTGDTATPGTGERRAWGRVLSTRLDIQQGGTVSPHSEGRLSGLQAGTDLWSDAHWRAGLYVGQLDGDMQVRGFARGITNLAVGSNDLRSQYLGAYATYRDDSGFYADGVLQAGRHRYEVKPQAISSLRTKGKGSSLSASLELGQSFELGEGWQIQPQVQLVHQRVDLDDADIGGARVRQDRKDSWLARVGVRVKGDIATSAGRLQPYARLNLYRASGGNDGTRFISPTAVTSIASSTGGSATELAAGFTLAINGTTSLYGEVGRQWASGGDTRMKSQLNASVGLRVRW